MINNQRQFPFSEIHLLRVEKGWLAVDKPCGVSAHNDPGQEMESMCLAPHGTKWFKKRTIIHYWILNF